MPGSDVPPPGAAKAGAPEIITRDRLTDAERQDVLRLVAAAAEADGVAPLSEHVMLHLRYAGDPRSVDLLLLSHGEVAGYAHLDQGDPAEGPSGELVVHPAHRRQGLGLRLTRALVAEAGPRELRLWAHGDLEAAARLAAAAGFGRVRALWQMRRSLRPELPPPRLAEGITVRTFVTGQDEDEWVGLNARAFASHPEQGAWTREDLDVREREPWFDPDGFFLAVRDGKLVGFHWTKVHSQAGGAAGLAQGGGGAIGEVYVVGVDPAERGTGLGRALTLVGLRHLRSRGLSQVMLYVDESNLAAINLYTSLGFTRWHTDVMFAHPAAPAPAGDPRA
ncbi:MAG TPA: mycothiol synthase [Streptosporangiaceae bacterium]|jgi:mycothiol synthase